MDICAKYKDDVIPSQSILGCLLNAHLRFTSEINRDGPAEGFFNPSGNYGLLREIAPWKVQPVSSRQFRYKIAQNTVAYYLNIDKRTGQADCIKHENFPPIWVQQRMHGNKHYKSNIRGLLPYLDMLTDYYIVFKRFIDNLWLNNVHVSNHNESLLEKILHINLYVKLKHMVCLVFQILIHKLYWQHYFGHVLLYMVLII